MTLSTADVVNVVQAYYRRNDGDEATQCLILSMGAVLLDVSVDAMLEMIGECGYD